MRNNKGFTIIEALVVGGIILILAMAVIALIRPKAHADTTGCGGWFQPSCGTTSQKVQDNQNQMELAVPLPQLRDSLERANISKRLQLFSNSSKVSYIYLISYGKVMAFYTVKGKITSGSKRLTSSQELVDTCGNIIQPGRDNPCGTAGNVVISSPELDGSYGDSAPYIYFWTTAGVYIQWNGEYMLADQPLQLSTPPELVLPVK